MCHLMPSVHAWWKSGQMAKPFSFECGSGRLGLSAQWKMTQALRLRMASSQAVWRAPALIVWCILILNLNEFHRFVHIFPDADTLKQLTSAFKARSPVWKACYSELLALLVVQNFGRQQIGDDRHTNQWRHLQMMGLYGAVHWRDWNVAIPAVDGSLCHNILCVFDPKVAVSLECMAYMHTKCRPTLRIIPWIKLTIPLNQIRSIP